MFFVLLVLFAIAFLFPQYAAMFGPLNWIAQLITGANFLSFVLFVFLLSLIFRSFPFEMEKVVVLFAIAYSTTGILAIFGYPLLSVPGGLIAILSMAIFFSIYQSSGDLSSVLMTAIIVTIMVWAMTGPYAGYTRKYVHMVKQPIDSAIEMSKEKMADMQLLITDPVGWARKQETKNTVSDDVNPPSGVEIDGIITQAPQASYGQPYPVTVLVKNKGETTANTITVMLDCDKCEGNPSTAIPELGPKSTEIVRFAPVPVPDFPPNATFLPVYFKYTLGYRYSTETVLSVTIKNRQDLDLEGERPFSQVFSYADNAPAVMSLNVGPQPILGGDKYYLLISFIKQKIGGTLVLDPHTHATVYIPKRITASAPTCGTGLFRTSITSEKKGDEDYWRVDIVPATEIKLDKSKVAYVQCSMTAPTPPRFRSVTGLISGTFKDYVFLEETTQEVDVNLFGGYVDMGEQAGVV